MNNQINVTVKQMPDGGYNVFNNGELIADGYDPSEWEADELVTMWTERLTDEQK